MFHEAVVADFGKACKDKHFYAHFHPDYSLLRLG